MTTTDYVDPDEMARELQKVVGRLRMALDASKGHSVMGLADLREGRKPVVSTLASSAADAVHAHGELIALVTAARAFKMSDADLSAILRGEVLI